MALEIVWTRRAAKGYAAIIDYLETEWTMKEVIVCKKEMETFFRKLAKHPEMLQNQSEQD